MPIGLRAYRRIYPHPTSDTNPSFHGMPFNPKKFLEQQHDRLFFQNDFGKCKELMSNQFEYRRILYQYLKAARDSGIGVEDAIKHHKKTIAYAVSTELRKGRQKDQHPGAIVHANTSEDFSYSTLGSGHIASSGAWTDAIFGTCENIGDEKHLKDLDDFIASMYIINHLFEKKNSMVPLNLFLASYGKGQAEKEIPKEFVIALAEKRLQLFLADASAAGHYISSLPDGTPVLHVRDNGRKEEIPLPLVLHDLASCTYFVIANGKETELSEWLRQNGLDSVGMAPKLIENLKQHAAEKGYFEELTTMIRERKAICCPDSRTHRENTSVIKRLGSIVSKVLRERILTKSYVRTVHVDLHFECGYLTTAMKIHEVGRELGAVFRKGGAEGSHLRDYFEAALRKIFEHDHSYFDLGTFIDRMEAANGKELSAGTKKFLSDLLASPIADTRNTIEHLYRNGFIRWHQREKTIAMPVAAKVDKKIIEMGYGHLLEAGRTDADRVKHYRAITLALAMNQQNVWEEHERKLRAEGKIAEPIQIKVRVEDFITGLVFYTKNGLDMYDVISNKKFADSILEM